MPLNYILSMRKKNYYLILSVVLLALIGGAYYFFNRTEDTWIPKITTADDENNFQQAKNLNNPDFCLLIEDQLSKNICLEKISENNLNMDACGLIDNREVKTNCQDSVSMVKAEKNLVECNNINNAVLKIACIEKNYSFNKITDCEFLNNQETKNRCLSLFYYSEAKSTKDDKQCLLILEPIIRANCLSEIKGLDLYEDVDADGLDFLQETINNTNPNKKDTDGDGYDDKAELSSGYNPDGNGLLLPQKIMECNSLSDKKLAEACLVENTNGLFDYSNCDKIINQELRFHCFSLNQEKK